MLKISRENDVFAKSSAEFYGMRWQFRKNAYFQQKIILIQTYAASDRSADRNENA